MMAMFANQMHGHQNLSYGNKTSARNTKDQARAKRTGSNGCAKAKELMKAQEKQTTQATKRQISMWTETTGNLCELHRATRESPHSNGLALGKTHLTSLCQGGSIPVQRK